MELGEEDSSLRKDIIATIRGMLTKYGFTEKEQECLNMSIKAVEKYNIGYWIEELSYSYDNNIPFYRYKCSECGEYNYILPSNECNSCRAKMRYILSIDGSIGNPRVCENCESYKGYYSDSNILKCDHSCSDENTGRHFPEWKPIKKG